MLPSHQAFKWPFRFSLCSLASLVCYSSVLGSIALYYFVFHSSVSTSIVFRPEHSAGHPSSDDYLDTLTNAASDSHPIDDLILKAERSHDLLLLQQSTDLSSAAARYRTRRGRHPPPGFDKWVEYAIKHDAVIVEQFFDRIEHDIRPFFAQDPRRTAARAATWEHVVRVRNGTVSSIGNVEGRVPWLQLWSALVAEAAQWLPDVDMPINYMDESRILVPWDEINRLVEEAERNKTMTPTYDTIRKFQGLEDADMLNADVGPIAWISRGSPQFWDWARAGCAPDAPGRNVPALKDDEYLVPPTFPEPWRPSYTEHGFVKNFTASMDPCLQPHLRSMHGTFVEPLTMATSQELIPLFGGCKLPMNNEILIPGAMYLTDDPFYSGGTSHGPPWDEKKGGVIWRGVASGGRHKKENWTHFQRIRLVQMLNGTTVSSLEEHQPTAAIFKMPSTDMYNFTRLRDGVVGEWLGNISDAGFVDFRCFPSGESCEYLDPYFSQVRSIPMKEQYQQKFIPDVDGNSFSARFRGLLLSTSLPLKSTIYAEWHDDRLVPWLHFAPLDNTLQDLYAVLDYLTRDERGDAAARLIAESGRSWGAKVLRREDMLLYVWRLLLEFARVCDKDRDRLGFVDDLL